MSRIAVVAALEALEAGDEPLAVAILSGTLEDGPVCDPHQARRRCPTCKRGPLWPGEIDHHLYVMHPELLDVAPAEAA